jgi:hypothetical protein
LEMGADGLKLRGYTGLINDPKGQFQANWAAPNYARRLPDAVIEQFAQPRDIALRLHEVFAKIIALLEAELRLTTYLGPIGIDALVYRDSAGECRLKPIVEINPRYTMGRLTVELMKQTCPGTFGVFRIINRSMLRAENHESFYAYASALAQRFPLQLEGEPVPRISEGALCLNDPAQAQVCLATFQASRTSPLH